MTRLDEMTVSNISYSGDQMSFLLFLDGDSTANGSNEDIYYAPVSITFSESISGAVIPEPLSMIFFGTGLVGVLGYVSRRRMRR
jgi:hypothetical protein